MKQNLIIILLIFNVRITSHMILVRMNGQDQFLRDLEYQLKEIKSIVL
jgi:hypothetical protein